MPLEFGWQAGLFAKLVGCDSIELSMPSHRNNLGTISVNRVVAALSK